MAPKNYLELIYSHKKNVHEIIQVSNLLMERTSQGVTLIEHDIE